MKVGAGCGQKKEARDIQLLEWFDGEAECFFFDGVWLLTTTNCLSTELV